MEEYFAEGIRVEQYQAEVATKSHPPLILVHGGGHGGWVWRDLGPLLAANGFDAHALNWLGRHGSSEIPEAKLLKMSIADIVDDIHKVVTAVGRRPILVGHSMGAMACQLYAEKHEVEALVLLTPVVSRETNTPAVENPIDMDRLWAVPPEVAREMFYDGASDEDSQRYLSLIVPESPVRCWEATRFTLSVDPSKIRIPVLVVSGGRDDLTPAASGEALARLYHGTYFVFPEYGHNIVFGERASRVAETVVPWLTNLSQEK